jgi:hypothetical protein
MSNKEYFIMMALLWYIALMQRTRFNLISWFKYWRDERVNIVFFQSYNLHLKVNIYNDERKRQGSFDPDRLHYDNSQGLFTLVFEHWQIVVQNDLFINNVEVCMNGKVINMNEVVERKKAHLSVFQIFNIRSGKFDGNDIEYVDLR